MAEVTFPAEYGGDGNTYSDDADPNIGLDGVGYMTRFVPCLAGSVKMAAFAKGQADAARQFAETCQTLRNEAAQSKESAANSASKAAANKQATDEALAEASSRIGSSQALVDARDSAQLNAEATEQDRGTVAQHLQQVGQQRQAVDAAAEQVAADREQTGKDRAATKADVEATGGDREQTGKDRVATKADTESTAADREQTGKDRVATKADAAATAQDRQAAQTAAASVDANKIMHAKGSGLPNEVGTAAKRDVGTGSGNLMEVGAFGIGSIEHPVWPWNSIEEGPGELRSGVYKFLGAIAGQPFNYSTGFLSRYSVDRARLTLFEEGMTDRARIASRVWRSDTGWDQGWDVGVTLKSSVGAVFDDVNGNPGGAIIESGENSNGRYKKFADGTLICSIQEQLSSTALFDGFYVSESDAEDYEWTFPHAFSGEMPGITGSAGSAAGACWLGNRAVGLRSGRIYQLSTRNRGTGNGTRDYTWTFTAIGRWK